MADMRLSLEGLPMDIADAIRRFGAAMNDCGAAGISDEGAFRVTGATASERRGKLVAAIKAAITSTSPATLPYAQTITLGSPSGADDMATVQSAIDTSIATSEADAREPRRDLQLGDEFPEPHALPKICACFAGLCRCEVINGRTPSGLHCKAQLQDTLGSTS